MGRGLNEGVKDEIKQNIHDLATHIIPTDELYESLNKWNPGCYNVELIKKSYPDRCSQARRLVELLMHRTNDEFIGFCKALIAVGQESVVKKYFSECLSLLGTSFKEVRGSLPNTDRKGVAGPDRAASADPHRGYADEGQHGTKAASTPVAGTGIQKEGELSGKGCEGLDEEADPPQRYDDGNMQLDVTDYHRTLQVTESRKKFYDCKHKKGQHMTTAPSTSVTGTGEHKEEGPSGETVQESTWCFEISNKPDHLKSGSILPYPMEIFVPTGALSKITELKVTVKQMTNGNHPPLSIPGNRQLGPIIRFEADQAQIQYVHPLLMLVRFPEEFLKDTDDYEYCVQYNSDKDIHGGTWSDITGYHEGQVCGEVIPSHQTAVLLLPHFCSFTFFRTYKMMNVEVFAYPPHLQDTRSVWLTCLVYPKPLQGNAEYQMEVKSIKGEYQTSEVVHVSKEGKAVSLTAKGHESKQWWLKNENSRTQEIPIKALLEGNYMQTHFDFKGQGQFSCTIEAKILGCTRQNLPVLIPLQERGQAVNNLSAEHGNNAIGESSGSAPPVRKTKSLTEYMSEGFRKMQDCICFAVYGMRYEGLVEMYDVTSYNNEVCVKDSTKKFYQEKHETAYRMDTNKRGFALVINVQRVEGTQEERTGTDIDRDKIKSLLLQLDFEQITVCNDEDGLSHEDILRKVEEFSDGVDQEAQRVAVFILSHGERGVVYGTDGEAVLVTDLLKAVNRVRPIGIPKMVVFQTCRGDWGQDTPDLIDRTNLITCYATKYGYVSWRNWTKGSWFIAALVKVFAENAHELEIQELMAKVKTDVHKCTEIDIGKIQTTETVPDLAKHWYLFPGFNDSWINSSDSD